MTDLASCEATVRALDELAATLDSVGARTGRAGDRFDHMVFSFDGRAADAQAQHSRRLGSDLIEEAADVRAVAGALRVFVDGMHAVADADPDERARREAELGEAWVEALWRYADGFVVPGAPVRPPFAAPGMPSPQPEPPDPPGPSGRPEPIGPADPGPPPRPPRTDPGADEPVSSEPGPSEPGPSGPAASELPSDVAAGAAAGVAAGVAGVAGGAAAGGAAHGVRLVLTTGALEALTWQPATPGLLGFRRTDVGAHEETCPDDG